MMTEKAIRSSTIRIPVLSLMLLVILIVLSGSALAGTYSSSSVSTYQPSFQSYYSGSAGSGLGSMSSTYWPALMTQEDCKNRQDVILQVPPAKCEPMTVRSDLLADQNVAVFCEVDAMKLNPLINVKEINNIRFEGTYPSSVAGTGFHPARAAIRSYDTLLGSPSLNTIGGLSNVGYVVVVLKQNKNESSLPESVTVNLTAQIDFDATNMIGTGKVEYLLSPMSDKDWMLDKNRQTFWNGKYSLRVSELNDQYAVVQIYQGERIVSTTRVNVNQVSGNIYMPETLCGVSMNIAYDGLVRTPSKARVVVAGQDGTESYDIYEGSKFLNNRCTTRKVYVNSYDNTGYVNIDCSGTKITLSLDPKLNAISNVIPASTLTGKRDLYVSGIFQNATKQGIDSLKGQVEACEAYMYSTAIPGDEGFYSIRRTKGDTGWGAWELWFRASDSDPRGTKLESQIDGAQWLKNLKGEFIYKCDGSNSAEILNESIYDDNTEQYISDAIAAYEKVAEDYPSEGSNKNIPESATNLADWSKTYGQTALENAIKLADSVYKQQTAQRLMDKYVKLYPDAKQSEVYRRSLGAQLAINSDKASKTVTVDRKTYSISVQSFSNPKGKDDVLTASFNIDKGEVKVESLGKQNLDSSGDNFFTLFNIIDENNVRIFPVCKSSPESTLLNELRTKTQRELGQEALTYASRFVTESNMFGKQLVVGVTADVCGHMVTLNSVNIPKEARIRLIPQGTGVTGKTNLTVKIGIEKRAVQLNPAEAQDKANELNETIAKWEGISKNLGTVVSGLKAACLATSAVLMAKSFVTGMGGESLARQQVMKGAGGWDEQCQAMVAAGTYNTLSKCLSDHSADIQKDVEAVAARNEQVNSVIKDVESRCTTESKGTGVLGAFNSGPTVNREDCMAKLAAQINNDCGDVSFMAGPDKDHLQSTNVGSVLAIEQKGYNQLTYTQLRDLYSDCLTKQGQFSEALRNKSAAEMSTFAGQVKEGLDYQNMMKTFKDARDKNPAFSGLRNDITNIVGNKDAKTGYYTGGKYNVDNLPVELKGKFITSKFADASSEMQELIGSEGYKTFNFNGKNYYFQLDNQGNLVDGYGNSADYVLLQDGNSGTFTQETDPAVIAYLNQKISTLKSDVPAESVVYNNKNYVVFLDKQTNKNYRVDEVYRVAPDGGTVKLSEATDVDAQAISRTFGLGFTQVDANSYNNEYKNPEVFYYEQDPYKGLPQLVPFDTQKGWYVATKQTVAALGNVKAYDNSGKAVSFTVCNVGKNGQAEFFTGTNDDICSTFNVDTGQALNKFPGLTDDQAGKIVQQAIAALKNAAEQYGKKEVIINGQKMNTKPGALISTQNCQDYMDPEDCVKMFNLCDPVICPSSRCNFGGQYNVPNVIQSGIIGSIVLCLPNFPEVKIPVCLSGIQAGIDGYLSVLKAYRDCLQKNVDTGELTGFCDEVQSIYMCDFFWKQAAPVLSILVPKVLGATQGESNVRGGGEYLNVQSAWKNAQESISYFTNNYAVNAMQSFQARDMESIGTDVCKGFISGNIPTFFKTWIEPDSPAQFYAKFDSYTENSATVPATAHYKVYYHIYGGKDSGSYYSVYLKDPPTTSYYSMSQSFQVPGGSGFIPKGEYADATPDFTAPEGYKQLCVNVNGVEKCGFKQVSTNFLANEISDQYAASELKKTDISSDKECVSGSTNVGSLINLNAQAGVTELTNPAIYERGIIRICATANPGGIGSQRYVEQGVCDDPKMKCWLDKNSVGQSISAENLGLKNATLTSITDAQIKLLTEQGVYLSDDQSVSAISALLDRFNKLFKGKDPKDIIPYEGRRLLDDVDNVSMMLWNNNLKGAVSLLRAQILDKLASPYVFKAIGSINNTIGPNSKAAVTNANAELEKKCKASFGEISPPVAQLQADGNYYFVTTVKDKGDFAVDEQNNLMFKQILVPASGSKEALFVWTYNTEISGLDQSDLDLIQDCISLKGSTAMERVASVVNGVDKSNSAGIIESQEVSYAGATLDALNKICFLNTEEEDSSNTVAVAESGVELVALKAGRSVFNDIVYDGAKVSVDGIGKTLEVVKAGDNFYAVEKTVIGYKDVYNVYGAVNKAGNVKQLSQAAANEAALKITQSMAQKGVTVAVDTTKAVGTGLFKRVFTNVGQVAGKSGFKYAAKTVGKALFIYGMICDVAQVGEAVRAGANTFSAVTAEQQSAARTDSQVGGYVDIVERQMSNLQSTLSNLMAVKEAYISQFPGERFEVVKVDSELAALQNKMTATKIKVNNLRTKYNQALTDSDKDTNSGGGFWNSVFRLGRTSTVQITLGEEDEIITETKSILTEINSLKVDLSALILEIARYGGDIDLSDTNSDSSVILSDPLCANADFSSAKIVVLSTVSSNSPDSSYGISNLVYADFSLDGSNRYFLTKQNHLVYDVGGVDLTPGSPEYEKKTLDDKTWLACLYKLLTKKSQESQASSTF